MSLYYIVSLEGYYDCRTDPELFEDVFSDSYESAFGVGKLSIDVRIFSSFSYFYILNLLFLVDFAFSDDLLFRTSYLTIQPKLGKLVGVLHDDLLSLIFYFSVGSSTNSPIYFFGT